MGLLDEIRKALEGEKKSEFLDQILKEKELHDALHDAGYSITVDDPQARARSQPFGLLSTLHKIDLVDLITEITTVKTIETIDVVAAITNIANIASLDLIDRITLIDAITSIGNIARIGRIDNIEAKVNPIVNSAFLTDFTGWVNLDPTNVTIEDDDTVFIKRVRLYMNCTSLTQFLWADTNKYDKLCFWAFKPAVGGVNIEAEIHFSDGTFITEAKALTNVWHEYSISLPANKIVSQIGFYDLGGICYLVLPQLVETSLKLAETPTIFNVTMANANTEYSQALPATTRRFSIKNRNGTAFRVAFATGKVATPTEPYLTIPANSEYYEDDLRADLTLYFACASAGKTVEIIAWT